METEGTVKVRLIRGAKQIGGVCTEIYTDNNGEHTLTMSDGVFNLSTTATPDNYKLSEAFEYFLLLRLTIPPLYPSFS